MARRTALIALLAAVAGFVAVRVFAAPARARVAVEVPRAPKELRCVNVADRTEFVDECPEIRTEAAACDADLRAATAAHPTTALGFPASVPDAEQPGPWTDTLAAAIDACHVPATLDVADCDEYPCMGAIRVPPGGDDAFRAAWSACPALAGFEQTTTAIHCPDGSVETAVVVDNAREETYTAALAASGAPVVTGADQGVARVLAAGRRIESVAQMWECNAGAR